MTIYSKTKTSYYRRLYVAYLIDSGVNTAPLLIEKAGMPKRTLQDTLVALSELDILLEKEGGTKNLTYQISDWGAINKKWIENNLQNVKGVLQLT
ncbi:helix-turn-helix domain-containing protein [Marinomonas algicola]|uniref:helix-turn-helix domain-containing protein n=1 Tax=Marinomonas algicola TaxID=2773454 RepID=UPI00174893A1|nr:helix-turn-helix domain-containing protein [Marinomonas algicola]